MAFSCSPNWAKVAFRVSEKDFEIKKPKEYVSLLYKTNRFDDAVRLFSNRSQMTSITSIVIYYYWTDARQHRIYLLNRNKILSQSARVFALGCFLNNILVKRFHVGSSDGLFVERGTSVCHTNQIKAIVINSQSTCRLLRCNTSCGRRGFAPIFIERPLFSSETDTDAIFNME